MAVLSMKEGKLSIAEVGKPFSRRPKIRLILGENTIQTASEVAIMTVMIRRLPTNHIDQTPGICGGRPCIAGHRIRVQDIALLHESNGKKPDEILIHYPDLTLSEVHAALAYFYDHTDEIRGDWTVDAQLIDENRRLVPSEILRKIMGDDSDASLPS